MKLRLISEQEFNSYEGCRQIVAEEYARQFAALDLGNTLGSYVLGWNSSEIIEPELELSPDGLTAWIGVNQYLVAINLFTGRIGVAIKFHTNILEIVALERLTAIRTETEVLLFNPDCSIFFNEGFPDITEEISFIDHKLEIRFLEGYSLMVDLQTASIIGDSAVSAAASTPRRATSGATTLG